MGIAELTTFIEFRRMQRRLSTMRKQKMSVVTFHPEYARWRSLPDDLGIGSFVRAHFTVTGTAGGHQSEEAAVGEIMETDPTKVGIRHVSMRWALPIETCAGTISSWEEQVVPVDWLAPEG